jgi:hypothetical protein
LRGEREAAPSLVNANELAVLDRRVVLFAKARRANFDEETIGRFIIG